MAVGTITIGETPCCGVIERSYECYPDQRSETGYTHTPGEYRGFDRDQGPYAPEFHTLRHMIDTGVCPDCKQRFRFTLGR